MNDEQRIIKLVDMLYENDRYPAYASIHVNYSRGLSQGRTKVYQGWVDTTRHEFDSFDELEDWVITKTRQSEHYKILFRKF